jgi:ABC-type phosphate transport system substrate-binding protein
MRHLSALPLLCAAALAALLPAAPAFGATAIIVSARNTVTRIVTEQAAQIFLGKSTQLTPIDLADNSAIRGDFYQKIAGKDQDQVKAIWSKIVFTGRGFPPKEYNSPADVKRAVAADSGAIGYIDRAAVDDTVRVVLIVN